MESVWLVTELNLGFVVALLTLSMCRHPIHQREICALGVGLRLPAGFSAFLLHPHFQSPCISVTQAAVMPRVPGSCQGGGMSWCSWSSLSFRQGLCLWASGDASVSPPSILSALFWVGLEQEGFLLLLEGTWLLLVPFPWGC